jgi:lactoylglutathione lyase
MRMDHVCVTVPDVDRAIKFYSEALGLKLLRISILNPTPGTVFKNAYMYSGRFLLEIITGESNAAVKPPPKSWQESMRGSIGFAHLGVRVRNLETAIKSMKAAGAKMIGEPFEIRKETTNIAYVNNKVESSIGYVRRPRKKPWRIAVFSDPDGIIVELVER